MKKDPLSLSSRAPALAVVGAAMFVLALVAGSWSSGLASAQSSGEDPFAGFTSAWRSDPVWYDGKAEVAEYEATRVIYGQPRSYKARLFTNKERYDPGTMTKWGESGAFEEVFKFHARDDVPTENYTYHFSTMAYVRADDLRMRKLDMGSQEDCGATFKQLHFGADRVSAEQFSYFPGEGRRTSEHEGAAVVLHDALPLVLRGYPFADPPQRLRMMLIADQTDTHLTDTTPRPYVVAYRGLQELDLPIGTRRAHQLRVMPLQRLGGLEPTDFWFDADPASGHVMVKYEGPYGVRYELSSLRRWAYWE